MLAARLYGSRDLRIEEIPAPGPPGRGEVLVGVKAVGICGSDLHTYRHAKIGDTSVSEPLILGHEFSGIVLRAGEEALDGEGRPLCEGQLVAVDPAQSCGHCEMCRRGHPNLCLHLSFCGLSPTDGCLREQMLVPARNCYPVPDGMDAVSAAMLEPLGVAVHAVRLARLVPGDAVSVHGAGPIGLLILQVARIAGADPLFAVEKLPWRLSLAQEVGAQGCSGGEGVAQRMIMELTDGRGVDAAVEAGWAGALVQEAAEVTRYGGKVVLVGIPDDDRLGLRHSTARRKGLTIRLARRMKHTYPTAIQLVQTGRVDVLRMVTHHVPLHRVREAFELNDHYRDGVVKVVIEP